MYILLWLLFRCYYDNLGYILREIYNCIITIFNCSITIFNYLITIYNCRKTVLFLYINCIVFILFRCYYDNLWYILREVYHCLITIYNCRITVLYLYINCDYCSGAIMITCGISLERYITVCHPFFKINHRWPAR